ADVLIPTRRGPTEFPTDCVDPREDRNGSTEFYPLVCHPGESRGPYSRGGSLRTLAFAGVTMKIRTSHGSLRAPEARGDPIGVHLRSSAVPKSSLCSLW